MQEIVLNELDDGFSYPLHTYLSLDLLRAEPEARSWCASFLFYYAKEEELRARTMKQGRKECQSEHGTLVVSKCN